MFVTLLPHREIPAGGAAIAAPLEEVLAHEFSTDAHICAYDPGDAPHRRCKADIERHPMRMVALIGDVDGPGHEAPPEWRARVESLLSASPFAWYSTRGGYRVIAALSEPFVVDSIARWEEWRGRYAAFVAECDRDYWLPLDPRADDPSRLFRLPNVRRDGVNERSLVRGRIPRWTLPAPSATNRAKRSTRAVDVDAAQTAAALAHRLPPSVEGHGGDQALLRAASELCTVLRGDADAIHAALASDFNPRCMPPWPADKLRREADRAAERYANDIGARYRDAREARGVSAESFGAVVDRSRPPAAIPYVVESLGLAPGKCSAIQGAAGDGKTPFALLLSVCVATGTPFLGNPVTRSGPVLYLAHEGGPLVEERDARICAGLGIDRGAVDLTLVHADRPLDDSAIADLETYCRRAAPVLVVIDTYSAALPAGIDANLSLYSEPLRKLGRVSDATGTLILALLHHRKSGGGLDAITGHSTIAGALQASIGLHRSDPENAPAKIDVACRRAPRAAFAPFAIDWRDAPNEAAPTQLALVADRCEQEPVAAAPKKITATERKVEIAMRRVREELQRCGGAHRTTLVAHASQSAIPGNEAIARLLEAREINIDANGWVVLA